MGLQAGGHRFGPGTLDELPANQRLLVVPMGEFVARLDVRGELTPVKPARLRKFPHA
jgi:hypothetical protein